MKRIPQNKRDDYLSHYMRYIGESNRKKAKIKLEKYKQKIEDEQMKNLEIISIYDLDDRYI